MAFAAWRQMRRRYYPAITGARVRSPSPPRCLTKLNSPQTVEVDLEPNCQDVFSPAQAEAKLRSHYALLRTWLLDKGGLLTIPPAVPRMPKRADYLIDLGDDVLAVLGELERSAGQSARHFESSIPRPFLELTRVFFAVPELVYNPTYTQKRNQWRQNLAFSHDYTVWHGVTDMLLAIQDFLPSLEAEFVRSFAHNCSKASLLTTWVRRDLWTESKS